MLFGILTQQCPRLQRDAPGVDVLDELPEDVRLELLDDQGLVLEVVAGGGGGGARGGGGAGGLRAQDVIFRYETVAARNVPRC